MIKKILHTLITKIIYSLLGFLTIVLVSQILGTEGKGEQSIFLFNSVLLLLFATIIGSSTLIYLTPRYNFSHLFFPSLLWILSSLTILFIALQFLPNIIISYPIELFCVAFLASLTEVNTFILIGKEKIKQANNLKLLTPIISILFLGILTLLGEFSSTYQYVISLLIGYFLSIIYGIYLLRNEYKYLYFPPINIFITLFKDLFKLGITKRIGSIAQQMNARLSFYLIGIFCSKSAVGVFSNGISLTEAILLFGVSLALVQCSRLSNSSDNNYSKQVSILMTKVNTIFTILALLILILIPNSLYTFVFGRDFSEVKNIVLLLSIGVLPLSISSTFTQFFASKGNFTISTAASLFGLIITIGFGIFLIPRYSIFGAAITTSLSYTTSFLIEYYYFQKWTKAKLKDFLINKRDFQYLKSLWYNTNKD